MMAQAENNGSDDASTYVAREPAWRLFASEFNDARHEMSEGGERSPTYVVTPLGAPVNRVLVVGVLTSNEPIGDDGNQRRAQVTDPTGVFHIYAGQYQPEALQVLTETEAPAIVAVVGKARTYSPEEGVVYTSIRPETIHVVSSEERDAWILEAAQHTLERVEARLEASALEEPTTPRLVELGIPERLATGIVEAHKVYGAVDASAYLTLAADALSYLMPAPPTPRMATADEGPATTAGAPKADAGPDAEATGDGDDGEPGVDAESAVLDLVENLDAGDGAPWDQLVAEGSKLGLSEEEVEEAMNLLMDRGRVFEPVLGRLKVT